MPKKKIETTTATQPIAELLSKVGKIILIRHGDQGWGLADLCKGRVDGPLLPQGHEQAKIAATKFEAKQKIVIYHSPLKRAVETQNYIQKKTGAESIEVSNLREKEYSDYSKPPYIVTAEMKFATPTDLYKFVGDCDGERTEENKAVNLSETDSALNKRVAAALRLILNDIINNKVGKVPVVVAHRHVFRCVTEMLLGKPLKLDHADVLEISSDGTFRFLVRPVEVMKKKLKVSAEQLPGSGVFAKQVQGEETQSGEISASVSTDISGLTT